MVVKLLQSIATILTSDVKVATDHNDHDWCSLEIYSLRFAIVGS